MVVDPSDHGRQPPLHTALAYGGGHSTLDAVMSTYDQPGSAVIAVFGARMLLEEAARLRWRFSVPEPEQFKARAKQYFDEYRFRRRKAIHALGGGGVPKADLGSAHLIGMSTPLLTEMSTEALQYQERLLRAAADVHNAARVVHFLD